MVVKKKEVYERMKTLLEREYHICTKQVHQNLYEFVKLQKEHTILKRERAVLHKMLADLEIKTGGE